MISSAIWDKSVNFSGLTKFAVFFFLHSRVLIYPKLHEKNHVVTCLMSRFFSFTCHRISLFPVPAYKWQPRPRMVKILTGECWNVCKEKLNPFFLFFLLFQLADRLLMNCPTLWPPKEKSWDSLVQFASISARKEVMYEQELFISTLTKFNPKKSSSGELRKGSRKIYREWSASKRILQLLS